IPDDYIHHLEGAQWGEHQKPWSTAAQLTRYIDKTMCNRISSLEYRDDHKFEGLMRQWFEVAR
ncbi:unnamed protein product, partial [Brassica rapa]